MDQDLLDHATSSMNTAIKTDDVIFNFFKQISDEKDDQKCVELGKEWILSLIHI